uniref:Uncharacterized protein n=1 Tax=Arion vulgaris TaxID=1028688 RepID=A0A0B7BLE3_9EUPU
MGTFCTLCYQPSAMLISEFETNLSLNIFQCAGSVWLDYKFPDPLLGDLIYKYFRSSSMA